MKVVYNARFLSAPSLRGWNRYTINLIRGLSEIGVEPILLTIDPVHPNHLEKLGGCVRVVSSGPMRVMAWEQYWLPRTATAEKGEIIHATTNFGLPIFFTRVPRVLTMHDAIDKVYSLPKLSLRSRMSVAAVRSQAMIYSSLKVADRIITVSEHAKQDIAKAYRIPLSRIRVTYEAADPAFQSNAFCGGQAPLKLAQQYGAYFFYIGGWEKRKNIPFLVKAFSKVDSSISKLVLAGGSDAEKREVATLASSLGVADRVVMLGQITDDELASLYHGALAFIYPSEYEGFGLQVCEAMVFGTPVLTSDCTSLPEILGNGGEVFPLNSDHRLVALMNRIEEDRSFREQLQEQSRRRGQDFSWAECAVLTRQVYSEVLNAK